MVVGRSCSAVVRVVVGFVVGSHHIHLHLHTAAEEDLAGGASASGHSRRRTGDKHYILLGSHSLAAARLIAPVVHSCHNLAR
jgi:hypothetical protein